MRRYAVKNSIFSANVGADCAMKIKIIARYSCFYFALNAVFIIFVRKNRIINGKYGTD